MMKVSNEQEGFVAHINQQYLTRIIIRIDGSMLKLINEKKIYIKRVY